jgi:regulator of protease activity HflC (stomatin/prohibitin superfamily)
VLTAEWFEVVETGENEVAIVYLDGKVFRIELPGTRTLYWKTSRTFSYELVNARQNVEVSAELMPAIVRLGLGSHTLPVSIQPGQTGLLYLDNQFVRALPPGNYAFWKPVRAPRVDTVDLRLQLLEVPGQEILTRDKVTLRVNILAEYRVVDPVLASITLKNSLDQLYRLMQLAIRQTLGKRSLDEVLADKVDVDPEAAESVRAGMRLAGYEVGRLALKDIILPGEIRDILNQVVAAEKQAQANLIRRREETAATRSLLNTAKLMEDNPVLVRLKELETLERVTEKVGQINVLGGLENLLTRLIPT